MKKSNGYIKIGLIFGLIIDLRILEIIAISNIEVVIILLIKALISLCLYEINESLNNVPHVKNSKNKYIRYVIIKKIHDC